MSFDKYTEMIESASLRRMLKFTEIVSETCLAKCTNEVKPALNSSEVSCINTCTKNYIMTRKIVLASITDNAPK